MKAFLIAVSMMALAGCDDEPALSTEDLAMSLDEGVPVDADLTSPDLANAGDAAGGPGDLAGTTPDLLSLDLASGGGGDMATCGPSSCGAATCGPSSCGYDCGNCTGGGNGCSAGACINCAQACTDDVGGRICPGQMGIRDCTNGPQVCTCVGQAVWSCTPACM